MKRNLKASLILLVLIIMSFSCGTSSKELIPKLEDRTLYLEWDSDKKVAYAHYQYCEDYRWLSKDTCKKEKWREEKWYMDSEEAVRKLRDYGFKLRVLRRNGGMVPGS
jgi:hypothetical protein